MRWDGCCWQRLVWAVWDFSFIIHSPSLLAYTPKTKFEAVRQQMDLCFGMMTKKRQSVG